MSIAKRGNGWQAYVAIKGQKIRKSFPTREEAEAFEADTRARLLKGIPLQEPGKPSILTMEGLVMLTHEVRWKGMAYEADAVANAKDVAAVIGNTTRVESVTAETLDRLVKKLEERGLSPATINRKLAALSAMLSLAHERRILEHKPRIHRRKESEHRIRFLSEKEEALLLGHLEQIGANHERGLCIFLLDVGCRIGDALGIEWGDIVGGSAHIHDRKTGHHRTIPTTGRVASQLDNLRAAFGGDAGPFTGLNYFSFMRLWDKVKADLGFANDKQWVPHILRHTFCSRLVQRGANLFEVQQLAGHKTLDMTRRYSHLAAENLRGAINRLEKEQQPGLKLAT